MIYSGDSQSISTVGLFARFPVLSINDLEVVESKRDFDVYDEMYSVRRRNETPESENLGFPRLDNGRRRVRSCG